MYAVHFEDSQVHWMSVDSALETLKKLKVRAVCIFDGRKHHKQQRNVPTKKFCLQAILFWESVWYIEKRNGLVMQSLRFLR